MYDTLIVSIAGKYFIHSEGNKSHIFVSKPTEIDRESAINIIRNRQPVIFIISDYGIDIDTFKKVMEYKCRYFTGISLGTCNEQIIISSTRYNQLESYHKETYGIEETAVHRYNEYSKRNNIVSINRQGVSSLLFDALYRSIEHIYEIEDITEAEYKITTYNKNIDVSLAIAGEHTLDLEQVLTNNGYKVICVHAEEIANTDIIYRIHKGYANVIRKYE